MLGCIVAALTLSVAQTESYLLRVRLSLGDEFHYKTTVKVGDLPESVSYFRMKVVDVSGSCYVIKTNYSDFAKGGKSMASAMDGLVTWNTVTQLGQSIKVWHGGKKGATEFNMSSASGVMFPKGPVSLGQSWSATMSAGSSNTYTLQRVITKGKRRVAELVVEMAGVKSGVAGGLQHVRASIQIDLKTGMASAFQMSGRVDMGGGATAPMTVSLVQLN